MTNTESRKAVDLDKLASWDPITEADSRELLVYNFDSDKQTLVGLGPLERARRSRTNAEIPDSQRMPQSEAPGPFVADDEDDAPPSFRKPMVAWWAVVGPALVVGLAVLALRGAAPDEAEPAKAIHAAAAPAPAPVFPPAPVIEPEAPPAVASEAEPAPRVVANESKQPPAVTVATPAPVQLAEAPAPSVVVLSSDATAKLGTVNVTSNPPASVVLDGRPIGKAPRLVQVPAGKHQLVFIHPLYGRKSQSVTVAAGQTATAAATF